MELVADANEFIVSLPFAEGAAVKAGDVIVVQDRALSAAELDAARAQLAEAEARVEELTNGPRRTTIRAAVARRDAARAQRDDAVRERDRLLGLVGAQPGQQVGSRPAGRPRRAAEANLREAEADLRELQEGTRAEQLAQARKAADSARANLAGLETTSSRLEVRAPIDSHHRRVALPRRRETGRAAPRWPCCSPAPRPSRASTCPNPFVRA